MQWILENIYIPTLVQLNKKYAFIIKIFLILILIFKMSYLFFSFAKVR